jgi:oxysterol-binding protein-related protein 9/10/11
MLEYWHYMDRPETFTRFVNEFVRVFEGFANSRISIGRSDDEVGRMLEALRFWFTKDLVSYMRIPLLNPRS